MARFLLTFHSFVFFFVHTGSSCITFQPGNAPADYLPHKKNTDVTGFSDKYIEGGTHPYHRFFTTTATVFICT